MKEKKNDVEKKIKELISNFESETGCEVTNVSFEKHTLFSGCGQKIDSDIIIKVEVVV